VARQTKTGFERNLSFVFLNSSVHRMQI